MSVLFQRFVPTVLMTAAVLFLTACSTAPANLRGDFIGMTPTQATQSPANQSGMVRWGGQIIEVTPDASRSCFVVLGHPLNAQARPYRLEETNGRFIACRQGFYDPALFSPGRLITVTGMWRGHETRKVGDMDYAYPLVEAERIHLWPVFDTNQRIRSRSMIGFSPWYPAWGWGLGWYW